MVVSAFGVDHLSSLLTRLWLPFSACVYFNFLLQPFLSALNISVSLGPSRLSASLLLGTQSWSYLPYILFPLLETSLLSPLVKQFNPYQNGAPLCHLRSWFFLNYLPNLMAHIVVKKATSWLLSLKPVHSHWCKQSWIKRVLGSNNNVLFSHWFK